MTTSGTRGAIALLILIIGLAGCSAKQHQPASDRFHGAMGIDIPTGPSEPSWWIDPAIGSPAEPGAPAEVAATIPADALYETGSAEVTPAAEQALGSVRGSLNGAAITKLALSCYADSTGNSSSNQTLSEQRAANLAAWIARHWSVPADQITQHGYGDARPVASNDTPSGRAQNRRCDIDITTRPQR